MAQTKQYISKGQIACIFTLARQLSMDNDDVHALIEGTTGRSSVKQLTMRQAIEVINRLKEMAGEPSDPNDRFRPTDGEIYLMRQLAAELGWTDDRLASFCKARFGVDVMSWMSRQTIRKVIEALKAMKRGGRGERKEVPM